MNILPTGMLTVIITTFIASVLIMSTGTTDAKSIDSGKSDSLEVVEATVTALSEKNRLGVSVQSQNISSKMLSLNSEKHINLVEPPPGPFVINNETLQTDAPSIPSFNREKAPAPTAPSKVALMTQAPNSVMMKELEPSLKTDKPVAGQKPEQDNQLLKVLVPTLLKKPSLTREEVKAPEFKEAASSLKHEPPKFNVGGYNVMKPVQIPNEPIWLQRPPISNNMPTMQQMNLPQMVAPQNPNIAQNRPLQMNPSAQQNWQMIRRNMNMGQQYMYVPVAVYQSGFYYPRIPMNMAPNNMQMPNNMLPLRQGKNMNSNKNYSFKNKVNPPKTGGIKQ